MIESWDEFYNEIEKLTLCELEERIKVYYKELRSSHANEDERLDICITQRKYKINKKFVFTPYAVGQIERVNRLLMESTAKVIERTNLLYMQMVQLKTNGDDFLNEFSVDGTVAIDYKDEDSVLKFDEDENNGQSDYIAMADILNFSQTAFEYLVSFGLWSENSADDEQITDDSLEYNWNHELLNTPELNSIKYFCSASHILFTDTNYSISDIIRIKKICNEVKITHKNLTYE